MTSRFSKTEYDSSATDPDATLPPDGANDGGIPSIPTSRLFGDYELLEEIARGGMGVVYKARQISLNRIVALKMILAGQLASVAEVQRFRLEAESAGNLDHPNILPIHEVGEHQGQHFFSMKFVEGGTLAGQLRCPDAIPTLVTVSRAVHFAHQRGILHRDLKPGNVLLDRDGVPYVTDFGLAKRTEDDSGLTHTGAIVGTPSYMAPEQASSPKNTSTAADVYALGAILYEALAGRPPFRGSSPMETILQVINEEPPTPRSLNVNIDRDLETIALKCLAKEPSRRYATAGELADELDRWQRGEPIQARPSGVVEKAWRWAKRRPLIAGLTAASAVLFLIGSVGMTLLYASSEYHRSQAEEQLGIAKRLKEQAEANEQAAKRFLYASNIGLANRAWEAGNAGETVRLLTQQVPGPGQPDFRSFEWHYLNRLCHSAAETKTLDGPIKTGRLIAAGEYAVMTSEKHSGIRIVELSTGKCKDIEGQFVLGCTNSPDRPHGWTLFTGSTEKPVESSASPPTGATIPPPRGKTPLAKLTIRAFDPATGREVEPAAIIETEYRSSFAATMTGQERWPIELAFAPDARSLVTITHKMSMLDDDMNNVTGMMRMFTAAPFQVTFRWHDLAGGPGKSLTTAGFPMAGSPAVPFSSPAISRDGQKLALFGMTVATNFAGAIAGSVLPRTNSMSTTIFRTDRDRLRADVWKQKSRYYYSPHIGFTPDGSALLAASQFNEIRVLDAKSGQERGMMRGHKGIISTIAFSPDGGKLATGSADSTIRVWNMKTAELLGTCAGHVAPIKDVCWTNDGTSLLSIDEQGIVKRWRPDRPPGPIVIPLQQGQSLTSNSSHLSFLADGKTLLVDWTDFGLGGDSALEFYDTETGRKQPANKAPAGLVQSARVHHQTNRVIIGGRPMIGMRTIEETKLTEWDPRTGQSRQFSANINWFTRESVFAPNGQWIALRRSEEGKLHFVGLQKIGETAIERLVIDSKPFVHFLDFCPDDRSLVVVTHDGRLMTWNLETKVGGLVKQLPFQPRGNPGFSATGDNLLMADDQNRLYLVRLSDGESVLITDGLPGKPFKIIATADGKRAILHFSRESRETSVRIYALAGGQEVLAFSAPGSENIQAIAANVAGTRLAAQTENAVYIWDARPLEEK